MLIDHNPQYDQEQRWSLDECIRRHDTAAEIRDLRDDQERRYREDQQRELHRNTQYRQSGIESSSLVDNEDREWYYEKGKNEIDRINNPPCVVRSSRSYSQEEVNVVLYAIFAIILVGAFILGAVSH